jgi:hypothetical protein
MRQTFTTINDRAFDDTTIRKPLISDLGSATEVTKGPDGCGCELLDNIVWGTDDGPINTLGLDE